MKRVALFLIGISASSFVLGIFFFLTLEPFAAMRTVATVSKETTAVGAFPISLDNALCAVRLVSYDGPFLEDGTDCEQIGIAALEIRNDSKQSVSGGEVVLYCEGRTLRFCFSDLLPGARLLALEMNREVFSQDAVLDCFSTAHFEPAGAVSGVTATVAHPGRIDVKNVSRTDLEAVTVYYKTYDAESDMYIGGITYCVDIGKLAAGESKSVTPYHVAAGYTKIVKVSLE